MPRPRCSVYIATSLDGFIAREDGRIDWLSIVEREGEDYGFKRFFDTTDTLVMGRKTYETALSFDTWHYTGKRCIVRTHAPGESLHGEEFYSGDLVELMERLAEEGAKHVYVDGGMIISQFLAAKLVDEVTVSLIPIVLGEGARLTQKIGHDVGLELLSSKAFESGLVQITYRVV